MKDQRDSTHSYAKRAYRLVSAVFGAFLVAVGFYVLVFADSSFVMQLVVGVIFVVLGGNLVISAYAGKESWLSKIGPLP